MYAIKGILVKTGVRFRGVSLYKVMKQTEKYKISQSSVKTENAT